MGEKDISTKQLLQNPVNFADLINLVVYDGEPKVSAQDLTEADSTHVKVSSGKNGKLTSLVRYRDVLKNAVVMDGEKQRFVSIGCENQSTISTDMVIRCALYDAMEYDRQCGDPNVESIKPIITIVLYWGDGKWTSPVSLHELLELDGSQIAQFVPDYKLNVLAVADLKDRDLSKLPSELALVLRFLAVKNDKDALAELVESDARYKALSPEGTAVIQQFAQVSIPAAAKEGGKVDMCKAIQDMKAESVAKFMLKKGYPIHEIVEETGLSEQAILKLKDVQSSN